MEQLQISFPLFPPGIFREIKKHYGISETEQILKELQHYKNRVRGYKGHTTKRKKKK